MHLKPAISTNATNVIISLFLFIGLINAQSKQPTSADGRPPAEKKPEYLELRGDIGQPGGRLIISQRSQPKTLNPLVAMDGGSRDIIALLNADLIHINRYTQQTEPALASSWTVSPDLRRYTVRLRRGLRFSDGSPFNADDVVFTFQCYLDQRIQAPQRDLLIIAGRPISVQKEGDYTVVFSLAQPYAAAERIFDGIAILPRRLLQRIYDKGTLANAWGLNTEPREMAGLGPFRLREYVPGQRIVLDRNVNYWKRDLKGQALPYLSEIVSLFVANADVEAMRFGAGETDVANRLNAADFEALKKDQQRGHFRLEDLGPSLEYSFMLFNENVLPPESPAALFGKQLWFRETRFRQAISSAIDRQALIRLAYRGRAYPLQAPVTPGNKRWVDRNIPASTRSLDHARELLRQAQFSWASDGLLRDPRGTPVKFSLAVNAGKSEQTQMATLIQQDLRDVGISVTIEPLEFQTLFARVLTNYKYEAAIMALVEGDADPNSEMPVLTSTGTTHLWSLKPEAIQPSWQREIDRLMREQLIAKNYGERKQIFDRVQELVWENVPVIFLVSPNILVGAKERIGNFRPAILGNYTLWNAEQLFITH